VEIDDWIERCRAERAIDDTTVPPSLVGMAELVW
jgi:hypothetical protein